MNTDTLAWTDRRIAGCFCDERAGCVIRMHIAVLAKPLRQHGHALNGLVAAIKTQMFRTRRA